LEARLKQVRGVTSVFAVIGPTDGRAPKGQGDVTLVNIYCRMTDLRERKFSQRDAMADARVVLADYPDMRAAVQDVKLFSSTAFKNAQLDLSIRGPDNAKLEEYASKIVKKMKASPKFSECVGRTNKSAARYARSLSSPYSGPPKRTRFRSSRAASACIFGR